ncbi:MAG: sensor histidine kinase, partial [Bacilli bacterium]
FIIDITDRELSEQRRREFSANVSHELKTPLTSIMGYAEIISNGIAKQADIPRFSQEIYQGAAHLLALIDDIIKLSRLDEGDLKKQFTEVDLFAITKTVINDLQKKAVAKNISINLQATKTNVLGIDKMLYELIYNLCDNAIIYNHDQGQINLSITNDIKQIILTIQDTGIGIAPKDQDRVFERFYRVDQSHSKDTGGTGLGLSIVKHIATLHDAKIELQSKLNVGTTIKIIFKQI